MERKTTAPKHKVNTPSSSGIQQIAESNLEKLSKNPYPGRGLVLGRAETGERVQVYWIMGRSPNSQNRVLSAKGSKVFTEAADPAKIIDPSLIIYNAMDEWNGHFVVSNGDQTDTVILRSSLGLSLNNALFDCVYEPDAPNFTPRITGICHLRSHHSFEISVLRKSIWNQECDRCLYRYQDIIPGFGRCVTTYLGDGNPLPSFHGEPILMPLEGDIRMIRDRFWNALNPEFRVSLVVKFIHEHAPSLVNIANRFPKLEA